VKYEIARQRELIESGKAVDRDTRLWDDAANCTRRMRSKELAHDYRYFPDPDLVKIVVSDERLAEVREALPEMPAARRKRFIDDYGLPAMNAGVLTQQKDVADYFEACAEACGKPKDASNWVMGEVLRTVKDSGVAIGDVGVSPEALADLITRVSKGEVNNASAKVAFAEMAATGKDAGTVIREKGLASQSDEGALREIIASVLADNPDAAADYRSGKKGAINFLKGQVMRRTRGKADPGVVTRVLEEELAG
jgi:aspartyl-tRNA(Asn)/glutamyl-tRNA(Gln) amidotransferase subunit B